MIHVYWHEAAGLLIRDQRMHIHMLINELGMTVGQKEEIHDQPVPYLTSRRRNVYGAKGAFW